MSTSWNQHAVAVDTALGINGCEVKYKELLCLEPTKQFPCLLLTNRMILILNHRNLLEVSSAPLQISAGHAHDLGDHLYVTNGLTLHLLDKYYLIQFL